MIKSINNGHHHLSPQQQQSMDHQPYFSFPPKPPLGNASFASYLIRPNHQDIHVNAGQADDSEICIFEARKYFNETNSNINTDSKAIIISSSSNNNNRVSPLNVTINNNNNNNNPELISEHRISSDVSALPRFSCSSSVDGYGRNYRARSFNATPTASSEASWNSQTGLLQNPPGAVAISMRNPATEEKKRGGRTSSKWRLFGRKCPCSGKKSVQVEEKASSSSSVASVSVSAEPKTPAARLYNNNNKRQIQKSLEIPVDRSFQSEEIITNIRRISAECRFTGLGQQRVNIVPPGRPYTDATPGFTFPILNQTASMKLVLNNAPLLEDPPRESLEIFQPPLDQETAVSRNSTRHSFTFPASPGRTRMTTDDDVASDASSDLFEIESFSTQTTTYPMYHRRDSLDEAASFNARRLAATNGNNNLMYCTRGSLDEAVTPSISATECYEPSEASIDWSVTTAEGFDRGSVTNYSATAPEVDDVAAMRHGGGISKKKGNGGMLLSCRCEKAVSVVGPNPVKCVAGSGMRHVSSRTCSVNNNSKPPLPRSQSHTLSPPFAT